MGSSTLSTRLDDETVKKLDELSKATNRSKSFLAAEAIHNYVEEQSWQIKAIKEGLKQADDGNFATEKEVKNFFAKWGVNED